MSVVENKGEIMVDDKFSKKEKIIWKAINCWWIKPLLSQRARKKGVLIPNPYTKFGRNERNFQFSIYTIYHTPTLWIWRKKMSRNQLHMHIWFITILIFADFKRLLQLLKKPTDFLFNRSFFPFIYRHTRFLWNITHVHFACIVWHKRSKSRHN